MANRESGRVGQDGDFVILGREIVMIMHSLVFHEDKVEGTVEECVDEICEAEVEDEQIGDCSHPPMI